MKLLNGAKVLALLRTGTPDELAAFLKQLPPNPLKEMAASLIGITSPVIALGPMVINYCHGTEPEWGAVLAAALHERAVEIWQTVPDHGLLPTTLSGLACNHVRALALLGRSLEVLEATEQYIPFYERLKETENLPTLKVLRIEALVNLKRIDEAEAALGESALLSDPIVGLEAKRLKRVVDELKRPVTVVPGEQPSMPKGPSSQELLDVLKSAIGLAFEGKEAEELEEAVGRLDPRNRLDPEDPEQFKTLGKILDEGERFLSKGDENSEIAVRGKIRNACAAFVHDAPEPAMIHRSLAGLKSSLAWAREHHVTDLVSESLWGLYLCHSRLKQPSEAADALIQLRTNLETIRWGIQDVLKRGGVFGNYPNLFNALCEQLQQAGRAEDLLTAIESSKGRVIADRLTAQGDGVVADSAIYSGITRLPELTRRERFHYLTYFASETGVYAAFVSKEGKVYAIDPIAIPRQALQAAAAHVDPRLWEIPAEATYILLRPLVSWLDGLLTQGIVAKGDHICYSADEDLSNVPLHYLSFRGGLLLDWFSVSRVHSAFHLVQVLSRHAPAQFEGFIAFVVPMRQDLQKLNAKEFLANLDAPWAWLRDHGLNGLAARFAEATLERVTRATLHHRIIHFATHGYFPGPEGNPFRHSFLLLAGSDGLPDRELILQGQQLTPLKILESKLDLTGSHVSMMACVSGLAKEGIAGDALGLDWAFIQAGAASLVSTHWAVTSTSAARFFTLFYEKWISGRQTRASAFRASMLELLNGSYTNKSLRQWTAFSLTGDFR